MITAAPALTALTGGYDQVISRFRHASRGFYGGPAVNGDTLDAALRSVEGLDPPALLEQTRAAVGASNPESLRIAALPVLGRLLAEVAVGAIIHTLIDTATDWFNNRSASQELEDSAEGACDALAEITDVSETGIAEIFAALEEIIDQLCVFLTRVDPAEFPHEFTECVRTGSELIDDAGRAVLASCRERDEAVSGCLDEFLARGEKICDNPCRVTETPDCVGTPEQQKPVPDPAPEDAPQPHGPAPQPQPVPEKGDCPPEDVPTTPQTVTPEPAPLPEPKPGPASSTPPLPPVEPEPAPEPQPQPQPVPEKGDCPPEDVPTTPQTVTPEPEAVEEPVEPSDPGPAPAPEEVPLPEENREAECPPGPPVEDSCCGPLGALGVGVALLCLEVLVAALEEGLMDCPIPEPMPELEPEPESGDAPPPPEDLAEVPEPPPPPKQNIPAAVPPPAAESVPPAPESVRPPVETAPAAAPPTPPVGEQAVSEPPAPEPEPEPQSGLGGARKAGQW